MLDRGAKCSILKIILILFGVPGRSKNILLIPNEQTDDIILSTYSNYSHNVGTFILKIAQVRFRYQLVGRPLHSVIHSWRFELDNGFEGTNINVISINFNWQLIDCKCPNLGASWVESQFVGINKCISVAGEDRDSMSLIY